MSTRARQYPARVHTQERLSPHLVRLVLGGPELAGFASTGVPDEWVGLVVPGQFQSRYYTVRAWDGAELTVDVVVHERGLVTDWVTGGPVGDELVVTEPSGSFAPPPGSEWLMLVADLTGLPAVARILETRRDLPARVWAETPDVLPDYLPAGAEVTWLAPPEPERSALAGVVETIDWPAGDGYFWMAGESSQMRAIRKHLMRDRGLPSAAYHVMGYWRGAGGRPDPAIDPGEIWRAGRAAGRTDDEIWAEYDAARDAR